MNFKNLNIILFCILSFVISCTKEEPIKDKKPMKNIAREDSQGFSQESLERLKSFGVDSTERNGIRRVYVKDLYSQIKGLDGKDRYIKFNLEKGTYVDDDNWDIAFYSRSIAINGGHLVALAPYSVSEPIRTGNVKVAIMGKLTLNEEIKPENLVAIAEETDGKYLTYNQVSNDADFKQDTRNGFAIDEDSKGMFDYNNSPLEHVVTVKKTRFLVIKTRNGHYAKLKIKSLYKDEGKSALSAKDMTDALTKYYGYYTFTYYYNMTKGDKKLNFN